MKTAKIKVGDVIVRIPAEYLEQQTCVSSVFENVPAEMVKKDDLIEANKTSGLTWYLVNVGGSLHISVPTDLIEWEE